MNETTWQKLPSHYKAAFEVAAAEAHADMLSKYDTKNAEALHRLTQEGVVVTYYPEDVLATAKDIAFDYYEKLSAKNPSYRKIYDHWKQVRASTGAWLQLSEMDQALLS